MPMGGAINVVTLIVRTRGRPHAMLTTVRRAMADVNAHVPWVIRYRPTPSRAWRSKPPTRRRLF